MDGPIVSTACMRREEKSVLSVKYNTSNRPVDTYTLHSIGDSCMYARKRTWESMHVFLLVPVFHARKTGGRRPAITIWRYEFFRFAKREDPIDRWNSNDRMELLLPSNKRIKRGLLFNGMLK